jgi:hypothetical protein
MKSPAWILLLIGLGLQAFNTGAAGYLLTDAASYVSIDPGSQAGVEGWNVDGNSELNQQWFWYRPGPGVAHSIDTISAPVVTQPNARTLDTKYASSQFSLEVVYSLVGGVENSGAADLGELIRIQNLTGAPLAFHFFQYANFTIAGGNNNIVQLGRNLRGLFGEASVISGDVHLSENLDSALSPGANRGEAAFYSSTKDALNTIPNYMLNNNMSIGPEMGRFTTWALEWDPTIPVGGTFIISKDLNITGVVFVPEPQAWSLISFGLGVFSVLRYFRRRVSA